MRLPLKTKHYQFFYICMNYKTVRIKPAILLLLDGSKQFKEHYSSDGRVYSVTGTSQAQVPDYIANQWVVDTDMEIVTDPA